MKKLIYISLALNVICIGGILSLLLRSAEDNGTAFFISSEVYNNFTYKMELEEKLESTYSLSSKKLDSLKTELDLSIEYLKSLDSKPSDEQFMIVEKMQYQYLNEKEKAELEYSKEAEESYALIWDRINQYVVEYGKNQDYQYIFGANGDGSLMYADESKDITKDIIDYVNLKYEGV